MSEEPSSETGPAEVPVDPSPDPERCSTCDAERVGEYCHQCGQRFPEGRLTLRGLWHEVPARAFNLERGLLHTFVDLCRRPGRVARDFVEGRRRPYVNPLTYFLVAATVQLLGLTLAEDAMLRHITEQVESDPVAVEKLTDLFGENPGARLAEVYLDLVQKAYTYLFLFFASLPFALYLRVLARRLRPRYNLAETSVFAIYTTAHLVLVTGLLVPITTRVGVSLHAVVSIGLYVVYTGLAARGFYDRKGWRVGIAVVSILAAFATFVAVLMVAMVVILASMARGA